MAVETVQEMQNWLTRERKLLDRQVGEAQALVKRGKAAQAALQAAQLRQEAAEEAARLMAQYADERQAQVISAIETIVSAGLTTVFEEPIEFRLKQVTRARRVEVDISVVTGSLETPVLEARGGGLAAAAGFLLRCTTLLLMKDARRLIVADEPFAQMSSDYAPRMAEFIAELCEKTDLQVVLVTHDDAFAEAADKVIRLKRSGDKAVAEVVR